MLGHRKTDRLNWFLRELVGGGGGDTIRSLGMMGGQFSPINDYSVDAPFVDLMKRARTLSKALSGNEGAGELRMLSLTRTANVVTAVLVNAPGQNPGDFTMATGMRFVMTCLQDPTFSADHVAITVASQTQFTYANTGADGVAKISVPADCPGAILGHCSLGANGHPNEDFFARLIGNTDPFTFENADLAGTYLGVFPGGLPSNLSAGGATLSAYTPGGSTFTLTVTADDTTEANATSLTFTGVPTDGSFQLPRIIRNDHDQSGATLLRPDFKTHMQRFAIHRHMDWAKTNFNPTHVSWTQRPLVLLGTGLPLSMMIEASNEAAPEAAWFCVPTMANDAYVQGMAEQIRDDLDVGIDAYFELSNEPWNDRFTQYYWFLAMMRAETQALLHGYQGVNDIVSLVRTGGNLVTATTTRAHGYTTGAGDVLMNGDTSFNESGVTLTVTGATTFTYPSVGANGTQTLTTGRIFRNLSSSLLATGVRDVYQLRDLMVAKRVYEISQIVSTAFGGLGTRAHMVYMGHIANFTGEFGMFQETTLPWLTTTYGAVSGYLTAIGGAPYTTGADNSAAVACAEMIASADAHKPFMHNLKFLAKKYGLQVWHYEISPDQQSQTDGTKVDAVYAHANFRTANSYTLQVAYGMGADKVIVYTAGGRSPGTAGPGSWGSYQNMTECLPVGGATAKKQAGIDDVLLAAPPANVEPNAVPGTALLAGSGIDGPDHTLSINASNGCKYFSGSSAYIEKLIYVAATDTYDLTLWGGGHVGGGDPDISLRVYVDDVLAGSLAMKSYAGDIDTWPSGGEASPTALAVSLTAGWRILKLLAPSGAQPDRVAVSKAVFV